MKNFKRQYFNMVEIVLALAVVAVAIVSLMAMLPVALRASKNSVAENSVAATVEIVKAKLDAEYKAKTFDVFQNAYPNAKPSTDIPVYGTSEADRYIKDTQIENLALQLTTGTISGTYKAEFFSGAFDSTAKTFATTDFDADVRIWRSPLDGTIYIPVKASNGVSSNLYAGTSDADNLNVKKVPTTFACTFFVEVSWPSGIKYENQEHRLYKFDYFVR